MLPTAAAAALLALAAVAGVLAWELHEDSRDAAIAPGAQRVAGHAAGVALVVALGLAVVGGAVVAQRR